MPLTETVRLDIAQAEAAIASLESDVKRLTTTQTVDVDFDVDESGFQTIDQRLDSIERGVSDVNREVADIAVSARSSSVEFEGMAQALGISENEARQLADEILKADRAARQIDDAAREVARQLGLAEDDAGRFASQMSRASRETKDTDQAMGRVANTANRVRIAIVGALAAFGVRGLFRQADQAIDSFNLLNESVNAVNVTFDAGSEAVFAFGENVAKTAGLARGEFQQAVVPIGALLRNFGFEARDAGNAAVALTQRAADLASVFNTDVNVALDAIASGLRGEANPLERFGAGLSAVRVEAKALELGLAETKAEITDLDKVTARYQLILSDTARVQGDFARTAEDPANAARILASEFENARATIGAGLIPAFQELLLITPGLISDIEDLGPAIGGIASAAVAAAPGVVSFIQEVLDLIDQLTAGLQLSGVKDELVTEFDAAADAGGRFADILQTLNSAPGDFNQFAVLFGDSTVEIERGFQRVVDAYNGLRDDLNQGVVPFEALADALADVAENSILTQTALEQFASRAGVGGLDLVEFIERFLDSSRAINLTGQEIDLLRFQVALLKDALAFGDADPFGDLIPDLADFDGLVDDGVVTLRELQAAAREAGVTIQEALGSDLFPAGTVFDVFAQAEAQVANFRDRVNAIGREIDPLQGATEQLEISRAEFIANLQAAFEQEVGFEANLARLANRGFDALADRLRQLGPGAATLAEEFLGNVADATVANDVFDASANRVATGLSDALREEFQGSLFTGLPAELARTLALAFESDPGTGFDSLAEKQARQINQGLRAPAARSQLEGAGRESAEDVTSAFAAEVERLAPGVGYDAAIDIARALTSGQAAAAATQAGIDWAALFSRAVAANVSFDFQPPTGTPPGTSPIGSGAPPAGGTAPVAQSFVWDIDIGSTDDLPSAIAQMEQAAQTVTVLMT